MKHSIPLTHYLQRGARGTATALIAASLTLAAFAQSSAPEPSTEGASTNRRAGGPDTGPSTSSSDTMSTGASSTSSGAGTYGTSATATRDRSGTTVATGSSQDLTRSEKKFISKVSESSPKELAIAHLAVQRASDPQVKSYAQQIISDHQQMHQELQSLAQTKGVTLEHSVALGTPATAHGTTTTTGTRTTGVTTDANSTRMQGSATTGTNASSGSMTASTSGLGASASVNFNVPEEIRNDRTYRRLADKSGAEFDKEFVDVMVDLHEKDLDLFREQAEDADDSQVRDFANRNVAILQGHLDRAETLSKSVAE